MGEEGKLTKLMRESHATLMADRGDQASHDDRVRGLKPLWTRAELRQKLPHILKFHEIFKLFVRPASSETLDILKVSQCLRAMGIDFKETTLKRCLVRRLLRYPEGRPPKQVSFELVMSIYCELADSSCDTPSLALMIKGLSCQDIGSQKGQLPYGVLRRMLTTMGDRLNESEAKILLDSLKKDNSGNVNSVALLEALFAVDSQAAEKLQQARIYVEALGKNAGHMDMQNRDEFIMALRRHDKNNTGFVAPDRMLYLLNRSGESLTSAELANLTHDMTNTKQQVDYGRFLRLIMNG